VPEDISFRVTLRIT